MLALAIIGLLAFSGGLIFIVVYSFKAHRNRWRQFAEAHGLHVTGLGSGETPYMEGPYRGVSVNVEMAVLHRYGKHKLGNVSTTRAMAMFAQPLAPGLFITARRGRGGIATGQPEIDAALEIECDDPAAAHALMANTAFVQWVWTFIANHGKLAFISEHGASAAMFNMVSDPQKLAHMLDECVAAAVGITNACAPTQPGC